MLRFLKLFLVRLFQYFIRSLDLIFPKNNKLLVFGAPRYYGNSRYLFESIAKNEEEEFKDLEAVWLTRDNNVIVDILENYGKNKAMNLLSFKGIFTFLKAKSVFVSHGASDMFYYIGNKNPRKTIINLWHGTPIKQMDGLVPGTKMRWDYMTSGSQFEKDHFQKISGVDFAKIIITGHPRNQYLFSKNQDQTFKESLIAKYTPSKLEAQYFVLYAPTYRHHAPSRLFPFEDYNIEKLEDFLETNKCVLIIRFHPNDLGPIMDQKYSALMELERVIDGSIEKFPSMQEFLIISDVLITDYSSSYFDFLLKKKPTIFIPYDKEIYEKLYGFALDFKELTRKLTVSSMEEFLEKLKDAINIEEYIQRKIEEDFKLYHNYKINEVAKNIIQKVLQLY